MANIAMKSRTRPKRIFNYRQWVNVLFALFTAFLTYILFNAVIGGQCDARCVTGTLNQSVRYAAPIALAAYCGLMCERAAVINIGIEGMMLMAAMVGYGVNVYAFTWMKQAGIDVATAGELSRLIALALAIVSSVLLALLHAVVSIRFKADQI